MSVHLVSTEQQNAAVNPIRRYWECAAFVAVWMIFGWLFRLSAPAYLVLGVPLAGLFQTLVRRRPIQELWVRDPGRSFHLDRLGWAIAILLMLVPVYLLFTLTLPQRNLPESLFVLCAIVGAVPAAFALRSQQADALRRALPSFGAALVIGIFIQAIDLDTGHLLALEPAKVAFLLQKFLFYFAVSFILEEVAFRGALDPHVYNPSEAGNKARAWGSALFVSVLWGLWHLPIAGQVLEGGFVELLVVSLLVEILEGIPLSFCWRQGGTLVFPAIAHSLIDAYRDALMT